MTNEDIKDIRQGLDIQLRNALVYMVKSDEIAKIGEALVALQAQCTHQNETGVMMFAAGTTHICDYCGKDLTDAFKK